MIRLSVVLVAVSVALGSSARAQDLAYYLRLRHQNHIAQASSLDALRDAPLSRVLEVAGTVDNSFRVGDKTTLLLDHAGSSPQEIETDFVPDWLVSTGVPARMIVKTVQADASSPVRVVMLAAAQESAIAKYDPPAPKRVAKAPAKRNAQPSRTAGRADGALYGSIGRGGTRLERRPARWTMPAQQVIAVYAAFIRRENPKLTDGEASVVAENIIGRCMQFNVDPRLVVSIMLVESGFDPASVSHTGAIGLGQLMPGTARWMGVSNSFDVQENIYGMVKLLATLREMFAPRSSSLTQLWTQTIAAYNAGDGAVRRYGGVPPYPVTQAYVRHVLALWFRFAGQS